jgi:SAM-dependent methyltransferase
MSWAWEVLERDHDIQNPISADKIRLLGQYLHLTRDSRVLDLACGKAGPALILASEFGCRILGVEKSPGFAEEAHRRIAAAGLEAQIEVQLGDAAAFLLERDSWDAALCLGATFVWGTIAEAAPVLCSAVRSGGFVAVGEPFWRRWPLPDGIDDLGFVELDATVARLEAANLGLVGVIASSEEDWDRYESLHWRAAEEWLAEHPEAPDGEELRAQHLRFRNDYLAFQRELLGWTILVGRKT